MIHSVIGYGRLARALVPALRAAGERVVVSPYRAFVSASALDLN